MVHPLRTLRSVMRNSASVQWAGARVARYPQWKIVPPQMPVPSWLWSEFFKYWHLKKENIVEHMNKRESWRWHKSHFHQPILGLRVEDAQGPDTWSCTCVSFTGDVMLTASGLRRLSCLAHLSYLRKYERRRVGSRVIFIYIYILNILFIFIYFWLYWVFIAVHGLSLVVASGVYSLVLVHRLLIAVASLIVEHGL